MKGVKYNDELSLSFPFLTMPIWVPLYDFQQALAMVLQFLGIR